MVSDPDAAILPSENSNTLVMPKQKLKLFVWTGFSPDWTPGLAFAIAPDETTARKLVIKSHFGIEPSEWGDAKVYRLNARRAFCVSGGG